MGPLHTAVSHVSAHPLFPPLPGPAAPGGLLAEARTEGLGKVFLLGTGGVGNATTPT